MRESSQGFEILTRPGWTGGVTAAVYRHGRFLRTFHASDKEAAETKARRWIRSREGGEAREQS